MVGTCRCACVGVGGRAEVKGGKKRMLILLSRATIAKCFLKEHILVIKLYTVLELILYGSCSFLTFID